MHVYIGGTFDQFHPGHLRLIKAGRKLATTNGAPVTAKLTVALNSDEFVEQYKGRRPVHSYAERWELLRSIKDVDAVVLNTGGADSGPTIERFDPDIILAGADWASMDGQKYFDQLGVTAQWLDERRITVLFLPRVGGHASSKPDPMLGAVARAGTPMAAVVDHQLARLAASRAPRPGSIADGLARGLDPVTGQPRTGDAVLRQGRNLP